MASDSQTVTAVTSEKPLESKMNEEAKLMEKEIVLSETADVAEDKPVSDSNLTVIKDEQVEQTPAGEQEKETPVVVKEIAAVVKTEESTEKGKEENDDKVAEQGEIKEPTLVKEGVEEVNVVPVDEERVEEKGKEEDGEKKVVEQVEIKEPILAKEAAEEVHVEAVDKEKAEENQTVDSVSEEDGKDKEETLVVDISESADEAGVKQVEPVVVQTVRDVSAETVENKIKNVEVHEVEQKPEDSEKVETQLEKAKGLGPEDEVVKTEEAPGTAEEATVEAEKKLEDGNVETEGSVIILKDEKTSESGSATCPEEVVQAEIKEPTLAKEGAEEVNVAPIDEEKTEEKDENGEKKVAEQVELKEQTLVKEGVEEVNVVAPVDEEKVDEKVAEKVEVKEPNLAKEVVEEVHVEAADMEKAEENQTVESVAEEDNKDKEETTVVDVSKSTDEAGVKQVEPVDVQTVRDLSAETVEDKIKDVEVEPKIDVSQKIETQLEKAKDLGPEVEVVKTEEAPKTTEKAKAELEEKLEDRIVETEDSGIILNDEKTSESGSASCPEEVVTTNQDSDTNTKKETEGVVSFLADVIEKDITDENHVIEEPSKDEKENVSEAKDVVTNLPAEDENIKKDNETPAADGKSEETLKETDTETKEKESSESKQEEPITEKVAEVLETTPVVEESNDEAKQQTEVTTKEVPVKQKHSNSIMSKVKQSLVKAKKAIIGKSPSSKTVITEEAKGETKA